MLRQISPESLPSSIYQVLAQQYPTVAKWRDVTSEDLRSILRDFAPLADALLRRMQELAESHSRPRRP